MRQFFKYSICTFLCLGSYLIGFSNNNVRDSLQLYLSSAIDDTNKVKCLQNLFFEVEFEDDSLAEMYIIDALKIAQKIDFKRGEAFSYICFGYLAEDRSDYTDAIENYQKSYNIYSISQDKAGQGSSLKNISGVYLTRGKFSKALELSLKSLKISEEIANKKLMAFNYTNIGSIYHGMGEYQKSLDYFLLALKIAEKDTEFNIVKYLGNVGVAYKELKEYTKALEYYQKSLEISKELDKTSSILVSYVNIGALYDEQNNVEQAIKYYTEAEKIAVELNDKSTLTVLFSNIGSLNTSLKNYKVAEEYLLKSLQMAEEIESISSEKTAHGFLSELYEKNKKFELAHYHFKQFSYLKDTIFNMEKYEDMTRNELTYEFDKKEAFFKAEQDKKEAIADAEKKRQTLFIWFLSVVLGAITLISLIVFRTLKVTRKQKQIIEKQKEIVEAKQRELMDSIRYAKRIQEAILPSQTYIERHIKRLKK